MLWFRYIFIVLLGLMLGAAPAWADNVDISGMTQVPVSSWAELKAAVEDPSNANKAIVLKQNIQADKNNPIKTVGGSGIIIDGGGFTITGQEGSSSGQFIYNWDQTDLIVQNVKLEDFGVNAYYAMGEAIYNYEGTIGDINASFYNNYIIAKDGTYLGSASGGAIYNEGTVGDITGDFEGNYAKSDSDSASGGAIDNSGGEIGEINGTFSYNNAKSESGSANGGAIYITTVISGDSIYRGKIRSITGDFSDNYTQSSSASASGGAIFNGGDSLTLINSSFYDNYVETGATKESLAGQMTMGGAILSAADLTIKADNGQSIFSGNKAKWADGEDSSAIMMTGDMQTGTSNSLTLDSRHGGLIQFDDKIASMGSIYTLLLQIQAMGATVTDDGQGGYIVDAIGQQLHIVKTDGGFWVPQSSHTGLSQDEVNEEIIQLESQGYEAKQEGDNYIVSGVDSTTGKPIIYEFIKQNNKTYTQVLNIFYSEYGADMTITGDNGSRVVFNNAIEKIGTIDISSTNVDVNEGVGTIYRTITHDGGVLNINTGAKAEDSVVNDKGTLHVASGGLAENTTVNSGGSLVTEDQAKVNNMLANEGANLDIDAGSLLSGDIVIHSGAIMGGSYDYSKIFKDEVSDAGSLTLIGGLNDAMTESSLINATEGKKLHLTDGSYVIGDGAQAVEGWDLLTLQNNASVKLEGDIALNGPNKKLIIKNGSELNLAGNSPSNYTIQGSVSNDGSMTFTHAGDDADDITTIYGNYTAYDNAQMTIDVNPTDNTSDLLRIDGDVAGTTTVNLNFVGADVETTKMIPFVEALNDDLSTGAYFVINRMYSSALTWNSLYKDGVWYVGTDNVIPNAGDEGYGNGDMGALEDDANLEADAKLPNGFPSAPTTPNVNGNSNSAPSVVGEAIAYMGLPAAGIEQTRSMTRNVADKVAATKLYSKQCHGFYDCEYDGKTLRNAWAAPVYSYSDVKAPYGYEADIYGFEGGFDIQSDVYNRLGVFASYRQGNYDFDGDGDDYHSKKGAETDIDSYILGLYHRYDEGKQWVMSQFFLGYQDVSMSSDDGVSSSTDGIEFGASVEAGLVFNPMANFTIEPILRLAYTQINYDDARDAYGKTARYDDVRNVEIEAGVKFEKTYLRKHGYAKVYAKPSIIQNIGSGDVQVTSLRKVDGLDNATLGRLEVGGSMSLDEHWSGFANAAYTFGSDYTNAAVNAGLNYAF